MCVDDIWMLLVNGRGPRLFNFKVTEPSPYETPPACAKRAAYPDPPHVVPDPESLARSAVL